MAKVTFTIHKAGKHQRHIRQFQFRIEIDFIFLEQPQHLSSHFAKKRSLTK